MVTGDWEQSLTNFLHSLEKNEHNFCTLYKSATTSTYSMISAYFKFFSRENKLASRDSWFGLGDGGSGYCVIHRLVAGTTWSASISFHFHRQQIGVKEVAVEKNNSRSVGKNPV